VDISYLESIVAKYIPVQNYLALYQFTLDMDALATGESTQLTQAQINSTLSWLRGRFGARTPTQMSFMDMTGAVKMIKGYFQHPNIEVDPQMSLSTDPVAKRIAVSFLAIEEEYTS
jgi:hypothetical protein